MPSTRGWFTPPRSTPRRCTIAEVNRAVEVGIMGGCGVWDDGDTVVVRGEAVVRLPRAMALEAARRLAQG
jgi:hypothetical protein